MRWSTQEVDDDLSSSHDVASPVFDESTSYHRTDDGAWHEDINVARGQSQHRIDLDSGFMRSIVSSWTSSLMIHLSNDCPGRLATAHFVHANRWTQKSVAARSFGVNMQRQNQYARDEHEQAWQDAYGNATPFQQKWGVGIKTTPQRR